MLLANRLSMYIFEIHYDIEKEQAYLRLNYIHNNSGMLWVIY